MGASCDVITNPGFAFLTGGLIGIVSALGFLYANKWVEKKIGIHDTCGVQWLHGIPGIYGGIVSSICAAAGNYNFGSQTQLALIYKNVNTRSQKQQAAYQLAGIAISFLIAMGSGTVAGFIASRIGHGDTSVNDQDHFAEVEFGQEEHHEAEHEESKAGENSGSKNPETMKAKE
jgi:ammonium transporter Rh